MSTATKNQKAGSQSEEERLGQGGQPAGFGGPAQEEIERRAYELYLARGGEHGSDVDDWLQAERELREPQSGAEGSVAE